MKRLLLVALGCVAIDVAGCASGDDDLGSDPSSVQCSGQTVPKYTEVAAFDKCLMCHSLALTAEERRQANPSVNFDTYALAKALAEAAVRVVQAGQMPPSPSGISLTDAEKEQLYLWAMCGTPN